MSKRIRYSLTLMSICILGVILTQGYWLYKDYSYYRGQPLFSADYNFYSKVPMSLTRGTLIPRTPALPEIIAYSTTGEVTNMSPVVKVQPRMYLKETPWRPVTPTGETIKAGELVPSALQMRATLTNADTMIPASNYLSPSVTAKIPPGTKKVAQNLTSVPAFTINDEMYKTIPYEAPVTYILQKMKWQFGASILLVLFTISCFIYMLITIFIQRKLSVNKNDFINNMTHELKTPLATVSVAIEAMRTFGALEDKNKTSRYLDVSKKELDHLSKMIEMIMQLSVYESHKMELVLKKHQVNLLIDSVVEKYTLTKGKEVSINVVHPSSPSTVDLHIDAIHIGNAIRNLIDNSIKYSNPGVLITISSSIKNDHWLLSVEDNGFGIAKKHQKDIFERFYRITDAEKPIVKGFGLGLSYVKQVIELHGGSVSVQSQEGKGTEFIISIPVIL